MILREGDYIHIKGEKEGLFHRVLSVNFDLKIVEYIEDQNDALGFNHPTVSFDKIDDIKIF